MREQNHESKIKVKLRNLVTYANKIARAKLRLKYVIQLRAQIEARRQNQNQIIQFSCVYRQNCESKIRVKLYNLDICVDTIARIKLELHYIIQLYAQTKSKLDTQQIARRFCIFSNFKTNLEVNSSSIKKIKSFAIEEDIVLLDSNYNCLSYLTSILTRFNS